MNINEALDLANREQNPQEMLNVIGAIEEGPQGKIRVYPNPYDLSHYVVVDQQSVTGEVLDVTEHTHFGQTPRAAGASSPSR